MDSQIKIWDLKVGRGGLHLRPRAGALATVQCDEVLMAPGPRGVPGVGSGCVCVSRSRCGLASSPAVLLLVLPEGGKRTSRK